MATPTVRPALADRIVLTLGGAVCGFVASAEGGDISAPVVREAGGAFIRKHLGRASPEEIRLTFGLALTKPVYEWLEAGWLGKAEPRSGSLIGLDAKLEKRTELVFKDAVLTAATMPAMDAASKTACVLTARMQPRSTSRHAASGKIAVAQPKAQAQWLPSNFRLEIDGLDCTRVSKVDAFTIPGPQAGVVDFPDLRITLAEANANTWFDWHEAFVVKGKTAAEKSGSLIFLSPDRKSELGRVLFSGLGIHRLAAAGAAERAASTARRLLAELYCEQMVLDV
jgi:hypothetical protein